MIDLSKARERPFDHQVIGVREIVKYNDPTIGRTVPGCFFLTDEMGAGKTKQVIDAAQVLYERGEIDRVLVVAPAPVRPVWFDPELGELAKHLWREVPSVITEYHAVQRRWKNAAAPKELIVNGVRQKYLSWIITNYDFVRIPDRLAPIMALATPKTLLVLDESSAVKNFRAKQMKACQKLRQRCGRVILLNGTPIAHSPLDLYAQGLLLDPKTGIHGCTTYLAFRSRYAIIGGWQQRQIIGWVNLDDLQKRFAPYVLRRLKVDCLDLPPKLPPVTLTATLTTETWHVYQEMRDELVAWLDQQTASVAPQAAVKALRLAQITSGFLGGVRELVLDAPDEDDQPTVDDRPPWVPRLMDASLKFAKDVGIEAVQLGSKTIPTAPELGKIAPPREISREKLDVFLNWLDQRLDEDQNIKLLVWCRFRPEIARLYDVLINQESNYLRWGLTVGKVWGGQKRDERDLALRLLKPETTPHGPVVVLGTPATGKMGFNFAAAHHVIYLSNDYSLMIRQQSEDRVHRPGQTYPVSYYDVIATGPAGQKTIDHAILKSLRAKEDLANLTCAGWIKMLTEE